VKKIIVFVIMFLFSLGLFACKEDPTETVIPTEEPVVYVVTFNSNGGTDVTSQSINENGLATEPNDPEKDGYTFVFWYTTDPEVGFEFVTPITQNITLNAKWEEISEPPVVKTNEELIAEDIAKIQETFYVSRYYVETPSRGPVNNSSIRWSSTSKYISQTGVILPVLPTEDEHTAQMNARFTLNGTVVEHQFDIELTRVDPVVIATERIVPFENLTTEYEVADGELELYFEENSTVPYVKVENFLNLLTGFIDPKYEITFSTEGSVLTVSYQYIDEEENAAYLAGESEFDGIYNLTLEVDADENTLNAPDPGFYWAYVYSTATNYGRHIEYDRDNENAYSEEGDDVIYDLDLYGMDIVMYEDEVVIPYYIANQLFAGSSYYNVYYNYDALYGIYALPDSGTDEYEAIRSSSVAGTTPPADMMSFTFNYLAFVFDYFYGLQEIQEVDTYYDVLFTYKDKLLNDSASDFEDELFDFIYKVIDEPHTSYGYPGYYNRKTDVGPVLTKVGQLGPRGAAFYNDGIFAVQDAIEAKWTDRPYYWFLDTTKTSVVLTLDSFSTSDIQENVVYHTPFISEILGEDTVIPALNGGNKYFYYNSSTLEYDAMELLVKGLSETDVASYQSALVTEGFILDETTTYYSKTVNGSTYYVSVSFDSTYGLFYLGVVKVEENEEMIDQLDMLEHEAIDLVEADSAVYMEVMMEAIQAESPSVEHVILDVTYNTGGNVGALYRVVGFITSQPFRVSSIDGDTNSNSSSYVYIDGVPVYENLNWALLISPVTFSAANSLATIFQDNDLGPIIGSKSGGGASSITPVLLPNGTAFTMSSNNINAYRTGTGTEEDPYVFYSNEYGIEPDYQVPVYTVIDSQIFANIYDEATLLAILSQHYNVE
jgi:uncharacterized repeat protein (TIGR02543 family)